MCRDQDRVGRQIRVRDGDDGHSGREGRRDTGRGILECKTLGRVHSKIECGGEKDIRSRLRVHDPGVIRAGYRAHGRADVGMALELEPHYRRG